MARYWECGLRGRADIKSRKMPRGSIFKKIAASSDAKTLPQSHLAMSSYQRGF
jgi:hypothetical protein